MLVSDENLASLSIMSDSMISRNDGTASLSSRESTLSNQSEQSIRSSRAAKVFGDLVAPQTENENSLCYSPSPFTKKKKQGLTNITNTISSESPVRVLPFGSIQFTTVKKIEKHNGILKKGHDEEKENMIDDVKEASKKVTLFNKTKKANFASSKVIQKKVSHSRGSNEGDKRNKQMPKRRKLIQTKHRYSSTHQAQASRAENAIRLATESVNQTLNAGRAAKIDHIRSVAAEASRLKQEWNEEKLEAAKFYNELEKTKRERLEVVSKLNSQYAKNKVGSERVKWQKRLVELDKEILFKSKVHVEHKQKMKDTEDQRRRMSVAVKAKHRKIRKANIESMRLESIQEQHEFHELKRAGERDAEEYKKKCEQERRDSLAFRGRECVLHRAVMDELKELAKEKEHESFVLKWAAQDDVKVYLSQVAEERRRSLAFRNEEGRRHRQLEEQWRCDELQQAHELEEMKSANQKDVEEYKKKCADRDRASLYFRGKELQAQKLAMEEKRQIENEEEQRRREMDTLARADVEAYINDCKKRRRMSLAVRAKEHRNHLEWKRKKAQVNREENSRRNNNASLDRKYVELAKEKERARFALNALRLAQSSFSSASNPFGSHIE